ncbi:hypothetical protein SAMN05216532_4621 [Streptomyces sp. 2231.1]|uniref:hypothetical protein n=1 Tax=Streptomyces sp. 2231.1 TaxID=1855347 RepID=UPI0008954DA5|nr:hypothetical protein [Streptomyces sp. 2231.1]SED46178.1 hypothetical protein SAMN05216532_4621 [Streptomyces sp. 2231.1]
MTSNQAQRVSALLTAAMQDPSRPITTGHVMRLYGRLGIAPKRTTARGDLKALARCGVLIEHRARNQRHYALHAFYR